MEQVGLNGSKDRVAGALQVLQSAAATGWLLMLGSGLLARRLRQRRRVGALGR
jgi:hypothetical protein